jgi:nitroreductase
MDTILRRHSVRSFVGGEISDDTLEKILHGAMAAPSAMHSSPWHFIAVTDRKQLDGVARIHPYAQMSSEASAGILVCGERGSGIAGEFFEQSCAAATENILLAATDLGLGSVWVGLYPNVDHVKNFSAYFKLPKNVAPFAWVPLGFPASQLEVDNRFDPSRVHRETW